MVFSTNLLIFSSFFNYFLTYLKHICRMDLFCSSSAYYNFYIGGRIITKSCYVIERNYICFPLLITSLISYQNFNYRLPRKYMHTKSLYASLSKVIWRKAPIMHFCMLPIFYAFYNQKNICFLLIHNITKQLYNFQ